MGGPRCPKATRRTFGFEQWQLAYLSPQVEHTEVLVAPQRDPLRSVSGEHDPSTWVHAIEPEPRDKRGAERVAVYDLALIFLKVGPGPLQVPLERPQDRHGPEHAIGWTRQRLLFIIQGSRQVKVRGKLVGSLGFRGLSTEPDAGPITYRSIQ